VGTSAKSVKSQLTHKLKVSPVTFFNFSTLTLVLPICIIIKDLTNLFVRQFVVDGLATY
jgi:hypothetical protein